MASRSHTDVFTLMRNNALRSRNIYSEHLLTDRVALIASDVESGMELRRGSESRMPPAWADDVQVANKNIVTLETKMKLLESLQRQHYSRPTLDDTSQEEQQIHVISGEITTMIHTTVKLIKQIENNKDAGNWKEKQLLSNTVSSLKGSLQDLSSRYQGCETSYQKSLKSREDRSRKYVLNTDLEYSSKEDQLDAKFGIPEGGSMSQQQLLLFEEENTRMVLEREKSADKCYNAIVDIKGLVTALALMVSDQGTVLDRIDYNVEMCHVNIEHGTQQLQKAESYERRSRKMMCILFLASVTVVLLVILTIVKS